MDAWLVEKAIPLVGLQCGHLNLLAWILWKLVAVYYKLYTKRAVVEGIHRFLWAVFTIR